MFASSAQARNEIAQAGGGEDELPWRPVDAPERTIDPGAGLEVGEMANHLHEGADQLQLSLHGWPVGALFPTFDAHPGAAGDT